MRGLRIDRRDDALKARPKGSPIVPGQPEKSLIIARGTAMDDTARMTPAAVGDRLSADQIRTLKHWIAQGAPYAEHWSFVPPKRPTLPTIGDRAWPRTGIDPFIFDRLNRAGLTPSPPADRFALVRRLSLDLRGLPPS